MPRPVKIVIWMSKGLINKALYKINDLLKAGFKVFQVTINWTLKKAVFYNSENLKTLRLNDKYFVVYDKKIGALASLTTLH